MSINWWRSCFRRIRHKQHQPQWPENRSLTGERIWAALGETFVSWKDQLEERAIWITFEFIVIGIEKNVWNDFYSAHLSLHAQARFLNVDGKNNLTNLYMYKFRTTNSWSKKLNGINCNYDKADKRFVYNNTISIYKFQ